MIGKIDPNPRTIDYWARILSDPTPAFRLLFEEERDYIQKNVDHDDRVLDMCCGDGRNMESLRTITENIYGLDNDTRALKSAMKKGLGDKLFQRDALHTQFTDNSFDYVIMLDSLINFKDKKVDALKEMARIAKETGKIIISVYSEDAFENRKEMYEKIGAQVSTRGTTFIFDGKIESEQFTQEEISEMAESAGLELLECKKIGNLAYLVKLAKKKLVIEH
ncbi:hypothetical protein A3F27_01280 [Candidatus Kaiserbacteria bacterium RIFCSPHIGHO2_12_FULL_53_13]|uniref:Methyltransferase type 11 domain-containing protein n=1 Tax=Candidatus Kaiserbacteria bacterium RIFCSPHIGHO2_12_FULL_53_13 TaxID=1798502 RepID=A0A1F6E671_9BACT|nr:MAG: hypothetical protein A3F27_01280 [Candidatus Kaiserbacteria bacterium RIFCSPHIGHO2_12_FULL_53_13]